jgi:hypothetical protein
LWRADTPSKEFYRLRKGSRNWKGGEVKAGGKRAQDTGFQWRDLKLRY